MTICPCCGFRFEGTLSDGCGTCGARAVGEPLPRPENELPFYGRSLLLAVAGTLVVLGFLSQTLIAFFQRPPISFEFWSFVAAAETAAWRLKWVSIPVTILVLWGGTKIYRSMLRTQSRYCGLRYARLGLIATAIVSLSIATLIARSVPERLLQHQQAIDAADYAVGYTIHSAMLQYRQVFSTLPNEPYDLLRLPDPHGRIAAALKKIEPAGYKPSADVAVLPKQQPRSLPGAVIRTASTADPTDDTLTEGLSFTNYELRLPGKDGILNTDDDWLVRDGIITKAPPVKRPPSNKETTKQ